MNRQLRPTLLCSGVLTLALVVLTNITGLHAADLQSRLLAEDPSSLAEAALKDGDARRGAIVFFQPYLACSRCHAHGQAANQLGPDLTRADFKSSNAELVEAVLKPSAKILKGYEPQQVLTKDGLTINGLLANQTPTTLTLRDASRNGKLIEIPLADIELRKASQQSIMPAGQVNVLASRQQFLDLIRYLQALRDGGMTAAKELQPPPALYAARPLPEYESHIDHAGMIRDASPSAVKRGEEIYLRVCANCHGTHNKPGSLPTSLRFATGKFKNGNDPFTMYQTITRGFGLMVPQSWMVPQQKYDVIHYLRAAYLKSRNPEQHFSVTEDYLQGLPKGDTRGPAPPKWTDWQRMDYGPNQAMSIEFGDNAKNFAYKGHAIRLDYGQGGVAQGRQWMVFDTDTMRMAAGWSGKGFIDWNSIHFNGRHGVHPRAVGQIAFQNLSGPGWAQPGTQLFNDPRLVGRDGRKYGPLPGNWAKYNGLYYHGNDTVLSYRVGSTEILEWPRGTVANETPVFLRTFNIGPREHDLVLQVAQRNDSRLNLLSINADRGILWGPAAEFRETDRTNLKAADITNEKLIFDGKHFVEVSNVDGLDFHGRDYTLVVDLQTRSDGPLFAITASQSKWVPNGKTLFIRGGRLTFDIGWVGAVRGKLKINDGKPHRVAVTCQEESGAVQLFVDGKLDATGTLRPKAALNNPVIRLGYTADNFPAKGQLFNGNLNQVSVYRSVLTARQIQENDKQVAEPPVAKWELATADGQRIIDVINKDRTGRVRRRKNAAAPTETAISGGLLLASVIGDAGDAGFLTDDDGRLRLKIPKGKQALRFTLSLSAVAERTQVDKLRDALVITQPQRDLSEFTQGGPRRWPITLKTKATLGETDGPFAVDVLTRPVENPWHCRLRLTGFDFYPDGDRMAVSSWDGSVFVVSGLSNLHGEVKKDTAGELTWQRMASGLFQPLGVKIVEGRVYVTCRDALYILNDLNDDGEADFIECFNNDHQVTEHFHEFAMGLQTDEAGNFYYAKSARHAKTALVPHHGTLLKVTPDGRRTEIVANGFRAANGVCINPDGTFIVTDQEGHWNPKNRINWVKPGGFYGNMFGYHDVTDSADTAMQQPLCWITNSFDRSPAELLWVDSEKWGPLNGTLLNFSYGYGKVYIVPHERVGEQMQGGMCELPLPQFPTGIMRGRFRPEDGQLYCCGMFAWAGSQSQPGGLYRIRYTGKPVQLPVKMTATPETLTLHMSGKMSAESVENVANYAIKVWSLKRTANYGSKHYDEHAIAVKSAVLSEDGRTVTLTIPELAPTWCMEVKYRLESADGQPFEGKIHNTIHTLGDAR